MNRHRFTTWTVVLLLIVGPCSSCATGARDASSAKSPTTYEYYVDSETGRPYSPLYEAGPVRYVVQFPGYNPYDAFLYGRDFVAYLFVESEEPYAIRNLWFSLRRDGTELIVSRNSYLTDRVKWKLHTSIRPQSNPPREFDLGSAKKALVGFVYQPAQLEGVGAPELEVRFDLITGGTRTPIRKRFSLKRVTTSEITREDPRIREREPGECVLVGPWWLEPDKQDIAAEYRSCVDRAVANEDCAIRVSGRGFLPRIRYDRIHFEGFFLHVDRFRHWWS